MASTNGKPHNLQEEWTNSPRWAGIKRPYSQADVERLRGSVHIEHTLARLGSERLWNLLHPLKLAGASMVCAEVAPAFISVSPPVGRIMLGYPMKNTAIAAAISSPSKT